MAAAVPEDSIESGFMDLKGRNGFSYGRCLDRSLRHLRRGTVARRSKLGRSNWKGAHLIAGRAGISVFSSGGFLGRHYSLLLPLEAPDAHFIKGTHVTLLDVSHATNVRFVATLGSSARRGSTAQAKVKPFASRAWKCDAKRIDGTHRVAVCFDAWGWKLNSLGDAPGSCPRLTRIVIFSNRRMSLSAPASALHPNP